MRRGRKFFENENLLIYVGTAIFIILAISIGIIMYMGAKSNTEVGEENTVVQEQTQGNEDTESASTSIGKTVEEQESNTTTNSNSISNTTANTTTNTNANTSSTNTTNANTNVTNNTTSNSTTANNTTTNTNTTTENKVTEEKKEVTFVKPTDGEIICEFAKDNLIYSETL